MTGFPFAPHGMCLLWDGPLLAAHTLSDATVAAAYYAIPVMLFLARRWLTDAVGRMLLVLFAAFICACGTTHVMDIVVVWYPLYWLQAGVKVATALLSMATAVTMVVLLRRVRAA